MKRSIHVPPKLLLLEDNRDARDAIQANFRNEKYAVISAGTAQTAIEAVRKSEIPFLALLLDIRLDNAREDGIEAARNIQHELGRSIPAIFVTAFPEDTEYRARADRYALHIAGWIEKVDPDEDTNDRILALLKELDVKRRHIYHALTHAFSVFEASTVDGLEAIRHFVRIEDLYDPLLIPHVLRGIEKAVPGVAADFIAYLNFLTFEARAETLLAKHGDAYVAYWRGVFAGQHHDKESLIREVYLKRKTTDFFLARLHPDVARHPVGRPIHLRQSVSVRH